MLPLLLVGVRVISIGIRVTNKFILECFVAENIVLLFS